MTGNDSPDQLDQMLRQWSDGRAMSSSSLDRLKGQVVQALHEQPQDGLTIADVGLPVTELPVTESPVTESPVTVVATRTSSLPSVAWFAVGAAAMVLLLIGYSWLNRSTNNDAPLIDGSLPPSYAWLQEDQLRNKTILLEEMETVFDKQLTWLAETSERVELGVEKRTAGDRATPVAVRVVVERRPVGELEWTLVWAVDIVALSEERVRLKPRSAGDDQLEMWTYALPDGKIAVDTQLMVSAVSKVEVNTSVLQNDREPTKVYSTSTNEFEVRIFQTAAVLQDSVG